MVSELLMAAAGFAAGLVVACLFFRIYARMVTERARSDLERWKLESGREIRQDSVNRSRSVLKGRISEQMAPLLPGFPFSPADARFIGNPVDFVVFDGYTAAKDGDGDRVDLVIVEVKKGKGRLTRGENLIRQAVEAGRVSWKTIVIPDGDGERGPERRDPVS